jgi:hypothetical protein
MLLLGVLGLRVHAGFLVAMVAFVAAGLVVASTIRCPRCGYAVHRLFARQPISFAGAWVPARCPQCDLSSGSSWPLS